MLQRVGQGIGSGSVSEWGPASSGVVRSAPVHTTAGTSGLGDTSVLPSQVMCPNQVLCSFLVLCLCKHIHRYHPAKFHPNLKHHDGVLIFSHFARAAACCLLLAVAAKPGRSTLDTKKRYKTKTGSTSSVTLALIKTEYWDRAGGGGNISYDW